MCRELGSFCPGSGSSDTLWLSAGAWVHTGEAQLLPCLPTQLWTVLPGVGGHAGFLMWAQMCCSQPGWLHSSRPATRPPGLVTRNVGSHTLGRMQSPALPPPCGEPRGRSCSQGRHHQWAQRLVRVGDGLGAGRPSLWAEERLTAQWSWVAATPLLCPLRVARCPLWMPLTSLHSLPPGLDLQRGALAGGHSCQSAQRASL